MDWDLGRALGTVLMLRWPSSLPPVIMGNKKLPLMRISWKELKCINVCAYRPVLFYSGIDR
jgi:hypothetical protein